MKSEKFLSIAAIVLCCFNVMQAGFFVWFVAKHRGELLLVELLITLFINFASIFFVITLITALIKKDKALTITWMVYAITELVRSSISIFSLWKDCSSSEKKFNTVDLVLQVLLLSIVVFVCLKWKTKRKLEIPSISRSISEVTVMETFEF
jgi:hypothetical protein